MRHASFSSLVLIVLGSLFLLNNLGYFSWDLWTETFRFWPILLIVIGLERLLSKNGSPQLLIVAAILIFALPYLLQGAGLPFNLNFLGSAGGTETVIVEKKLGTLIGAKVNLDLKVASLEIGALDKTSTLLVKGEVGFNKLGGEPQINFDPKDGVALLDIIAGSNSIPVNLGGGQWKLNFTPVVPIEFVAANTSGDVSLNLTELDVPILKMELGKTQTHVTFANKRIQAQISATEGVITLNFPPEANVKLEIPEGSSMDIATRFGKIGEGYQTGEFEKAQEKLEIKVTPGQAKVIVN